LFAGLEEVLRDRGRLLAFLALVLGLLFAALAFFVLVRVLVALLAERRRAGFSGVVSDADAGAGAGFAASGAGPRPSPMLLANWDRCSE
jgi:hypothetical protein